MDYSIFLLNSYEENKKRFPGEKERAMGHAIANTFKSVVGSSVTTIAGFAALCAMTFTLGRDLGIVMAKGVVMGVLCCVTLLPSLVLVFDKWIEKTTHRPLFSNMNKPSEFITKHYAVWIVLFLVLLFPAIYGNNHTKIYYNIAQSLPGSLDSNVANEKLEKDFEMGNMHMILMDKNMDGVQKQKMLDQVDEVDGVKWTISMNSLIGPSVPDSMIPDDIKSMLKSDHYELAFICSEYASATDQVNTQIAQIDDIVKSYDDDAMVIGEAPLMKDLQDVTDVDLTMVNVLSMAAIFLIIMIVFKSISLPVILVSVIEFAIAVNMAFPYYMGTELPFVASIVIGTIQLGATVDYAILMTSRYQKERGRGRSKKEAIAIAHKTSMPSIISSGLSFFAATFGVACYSKVDIHGFFCHLLEKDNIKIFCGLQHIHQMMRDAIHFFRCDLGGTNIHMAVNLHGICGDDLSVYCFCKGNGKFCFSHGSRSGKDDKRFFHRFSPFMIGILHDTFKFFFNLCLTHGNDGWPSMRTVIRIFQCQKFIDQLVGFLG